MSFFKTFWAVLLSLALTTQACATPIFFNLNFTAVSVSTAFWTSTASAGSTRTDTGFRAGYQFTVGSVSKTITHVGYVTSATGGTGSHVVTIFNLSGTKMGEGTVDITGAGANVGVYVAITNFTGAANTTYNIVADVGTDSWRNESTLNTTAIATIVKSCYIFVPGDPIAFNYGTNGTVFGFPDFKYQ